MVYSADGIFGRGFCNAFLFVMLELSTIGMGMNASIKP